MKLVKMIIIGCILGYVAPRALGFLGGLFGSPKYIVIDVSGGPNAKKYPVEKMSRAPKYGWTKTYKTTKIVLRYWVAD